MKKKSFTYSDLSNKQLNHLKEFYIQTKVDSMSIEELKEFVLEIITHQITDTIDKEEEIEAWREMSDFFDEQFERIILDIQQKVRDDGSIKETDNDPQKERQELLERNNIEKEKKDMWDE